MSPHIIGSANYPARAYGVTAPMRNREAVRHCPELTLVSFAAGDYAEAGRELMSLFERFARRVEPGSMEEAFLDVHPGDPAAVAAAIRAAVRVGLGLPVSVGVGRTRLMAKLASRRAKPNGVRAFRPEDEPALRAALSSEDLWGVGPRTAGRLADELGGGGCASWPATPSGRSPRVGTTMARRLVAMHAGTEDDTVKLLGPRRSVAATKTLRGTRSRAVVRSYLHQVVNTAVRRLHAARGQTHQVEVQVRLEDGTLRCERVDLDAGTDELATVAECAHLMLDLTGYADDGRAVVLVGVALRLTGVAASRSQEVLPFDEL